MNPLTPQEASTRTKKGWDTRKKRNAAIGGGAAAAIAAPKLNNARRLYRHQYEWQRPDGQSVKLRGFSPREVQQMQPSLHHIDAHLKANPAVESIERRGIGFLNTTITAGRAKAVYEPGVSRRTGFVGGRATDPSHPQVDTAGKSVKEMLSTEKGRSTIRNAGKFTGPLHQSKEGKIFVKPSSARAEKGAHLGGLVTHEMGHAVDAGHIKPDTEGSKPLSIAKNFGKREEAYGDMQEILGKKGKIGESPQGYQATERIEDFAESFRGDLNRRTGKPSKMPPTIGSHFDPNISHGRQQFMSRHVFHDVPHPDAGRVVAKKGMHVHTNKFLGGAAVVTAAGVGAYEYNKFRKQR